MGTAKMLLREALLLAGSVLLATVGLMLFVVLMVAVRPLLFIGFIVAGLGGLALSCLSPRFRDWFETVGERPT